MPRWLASRSYYRKSGPCRSSPRNGIRRRGEGRESGLCQPKRKPPGHPWRGGGPPVPSVELVSMNLCRWLFCRGAFLRPLDRYPAEPCPRRASTSAGWDESASWRRHRRLPVKLLQRTASAASRDNESFPIDGLVSGIKSQRIDAPNKATDSRPGHRLRTYMDLGHYIRTNSNSERRLSPFEVSALWSTVRANQFPRPVNLAEPNRWFVITVNIPSRARFAIVTPASGLPPNGPCQAPAFL